MSFAKTANTTPVVNKQNLNILHVDFLLIHRFFPLLYMYMYMYMYIYFSSGNNFQGHKLCSPNLDFDAIKGKKTHLNEEG